MKLEQWVLFLDMLGYQEINGGISDDIESKSFFEFMISNQRIFDEQNNPKIKEHYSKSSFNLYDFYEIQTTFVSDSLIINYKPKELKEFSITEEIRIQHSANTLFIIMQRIQSYIYNCFSQKKILVRGGVSNKFCSIKNNFAVGEGLIEAYKYESKIAKKPRIAISSSIYENNKLIDAIDLISKTIYNQNNSFITKDEDGVYYLNHLKYFLLFNFNTPTHEHFVYAYLSEHKTAIEDNLNNINKKITNSHDEENISRLEDVKKKLNWVKNYHNSNLTSNQIAHKIQIN